jgi:hypothetical protein
MSSSAACYGLRASRGWGLNQQTNVSGRFILNINTSPKEHLVFTIYLRYSPLTRRQATFSFVLSRSGHVLDLTTTHARASALYVMGDRQWLLGDACALTYKRVLSTLRYGVWASRGWWYDTEPTDRKLLIFKIWTLQTNIMFIYNCLARYIMYYLFYIFVLQGSSFGQWAIFYTRGLIHLGRTIGSSSGWSHRLAFGLLRRSTGRTARFMDFVTDQLVRLLGTHFYSVLTSLPTSWLDYSVLVSSPTSWSDYSSLHR